MAQQEEEIVLGKALDKSLLRRLVVYLRPYRIHVFGSIAMAIAAAFFGVLRPYLTKVFIDAHLMAVPLLRPMARAVTAGYLSYYGPADAKVVDHAVSIGSMGSMMEVIGLILLVLVLQGALTYALTVVMQYVGQETIHRIRIELFEHLQRLSMRFFDTNPIGRLVTRVTSDVEVLNEFFASGLVMIAANIFILLWIVIMMFAMSIELTLLTLVPLALLLWATAIFRRRVRAVYREVRVQLARINAFLSEHVTGIQTVKLFAQELRTHVQFEKINESYTVAQVRMVFYYALFFPTVDFLSTLAVALILWYGGGAILQTAVGINVGTLLGEHAITIGVLFAFIQYTEMFFRPARDLSEKYNVLQNTMASSERIFQLLDTESYAPSVYTAGEHPEPFAITRGAIAFEHVDFSYDGEHPVLRDVTFSVEPGETIAIVGATGAGKTSIINILMRYYEFQNGTVRVDARDIRTIPTEELRRDIGLVMQDVFLFRGTILDNITLNNERISDERAREAARTVGVSRFIESLPDDYATPVQERGSTLSVGQKQLLSFARALAHDPRVLILDEATSSVDTETEQLIQRAIEKLLEGRTSIVIAHRLSTIQNADRILVMHHGELREQGTHEELLALGGIYATLYRLQYKVDDRVSDTSADGNGAKKAATRSL